MFSSETNRPWLWHCMEALDKVSHHRWKTSLWHFKVCLPKVADLFRSASLRNFYFAKSEINHIAVDSSDVTTWWWQSRCVVRLVYMVWVLFEILVFNLWPTMPVSFFSTSSRNFSCKYVTGFSVLNQFDVVQNVFFYHYEVWLLGRDFSRPLSVAAVTLPIQEKKKMLRIFFSNITSCWWSLL